MTLQLAPALTQRPLQRTVRKWKFSLHDSEITSPNPNDLGPINRIRWLRKARGKRIELILDKPGSLSFNLASGSIEAEDIKGYEIVRCVLAHAPDKNGVYQPVWSGPIWTAEVDEPTGKLNVTCVGWDQIFDHREFRNDVNFVRATNGEMAAAICRTASNQYANDGYGLGASAEDLLFGAGDFENTATIDASGQIWTFVGLIAIGDIYNRPGTGLYQAVSGPNSVPPSGARWLRTCNQGIDKATYVWVSSRQGLTVENRNVGFAVEPNTPYRVDGIYKVINCTSGGQGVLQIRWYDATGVLISTTVLMNPTAAGPGGEFGYAPEDTAIDTSCMSPSTAARAAIVIGAQSGTARPGGASAGNEVIDIFWDNIIVTKANDSGRRPFIIRTNKDDPYILNQMIFPSMEGSSAWSPVPGTVTHSISTDWSISGKYSGKLVLLGISITGEYGASYYATAGPGTPMDPATSIYFRVNFKIEKAGSNGTYIRYRRGTYGGAEFDRYTSQVVYGTGLRQIELYIPSLPPQTVGNDAIFEIMTSALPADDLQIYFDDITVVKDIAPPIPFYEGNLKDARFYDKNFAGREQRSMGPVFTRSYTRGTKLVQVLTEMTEIEMGVDYSIHPLSRKLRLHWNQILPGTTLRGRGSDKRSVVFGYGVAPHNVAQVHDASDSSKLKDRVNTEGKVGRGMAQDLDQIERIGIFEDTIQLTDVVDPPPPQPSILAVYAGSEVAMFSRPFRTITFQPKRYVTGESVPMFGVDYDIGDLTTLKADKNILKIGVPGGKLPDNPPKITRRIDDFQRNVQDLVPAETLEGQFIWSNRDYFTGLNQWSVTKFGKYAYPENPSICGARLLNMYGPDWDFAWQICKPTTDRFIDFYWGSQIAGLSGLVAAGEDYHRLRYTMSPTGNTSNDTIMINGSIEVPLITVSSCKHPTQTTQCYLWFQKRGTHYKLYRQVTAPGTILDTYSKLWLANPWEQIASFDLVALNQACYIGMAQYTNNTTGKDPSIGFLHGGTYVSNFQNFTISPGQTMRVFGANISFDDNNDGENIESLTTMLGG